MLPAEGRGGQGTVGRAGASVASVCFHESVHSDCLDLLPTLSPASTPRSPAVLHKVREPGRAQREAGGKEGWSPAPLGDQPGCPGLARGGGMRRWLIGESPVAIVCSCSLWGRAAEGDKASGQLGL